MKLLIVDAFTDRPLTGNPAAVCLLETERDSQWMQAVAAEMNLSGPAFQASARGGIVRVRVNGDRVLLGGQAVTAMNGELLSPDDGDLSMTPKGRDRT